MKKLIILLTIAISSISFSQKENEKAIINVSLNKYIGNIHSEDETNPKINGQGNFNAPIVVIVDFSIKTSETVYIKPLTYYSIKNGVGTVDYSSNPITVQSNTDYVQVNNGKSTYSTKMYGLGFSVLKRTSRNLFVGGGFTVGMVESTFINQFETTYAVTVPPLPNPSHEAGINEIKKVQYNIPIDVRYLIPIGNKYITTNFSIFMGKCTFLNAGIGFAF